MCPWADVLYGRDAKWWTVMGDDARQFSGEKYAWTGNHIAEVCPAPVAGNSGACAMLLASHWGAERVTLLGYDCKVGADGKRHWHGKHRRGLGDAVSLPKFYGQFEKIITDMADIIVRNASRDTDLDIWPTALLEDELA